MIDWITAKVPCGHPELVHGGRLASISADGEIEWEIQRAQAVVGSHEATMHVQTKRPGELWISGNPAKWLQGHNLFGSDDLVGLVYTVMRRLVGLLDLYATVGEYRAWESGEFTLTRVDCTAMWAPRRQDVRAWIRAVELQAKSRHGRPVSRGGTVYFGKNSRRLGSEVPKGDELQATGKGCGFR